MGKVLALLDEENVDILVGLTIATTLRKRRRKTPVVNSSYPSNKEGIWYIP